MNTNSSLEQPRFIEPGTPEETEAREGPLPFFITPRGLRYPREKLDQRPDIEAAEPPSNVKKTT